MTINDWFNNGCNYKDGVALYVSLANHNKNLVRVFARKETPQNKMKLKYELQKKIATNLKEPVAILVKNETAKKVVPGPIISAPKEPAAENKYFRKLLINQLPVELHPFYIQQKTDYNTYCSLKIQLNELNIIRDTFGNIILDKDGKPKVKAQTPLMIEKARVICLKIESLFDAIDKTWQIIDHYLKTKEVIIIQEKDFTELSEGKLRDKLASVASSITRQKTRHALLTKKLANAIAKKFVIKYERDLAKCNAKLMQLEQDKIKLINIRDNEK